MSDRTERIEAYLAGTMDDDTRASFEQDLESDKTLREDLAKMPVIHAALEFSVEEDLRTKLHTLAQSRPALVRVRRMFPRWAAAAGILLLIGAGLWYYMGINAPSLSQFAQAEYLTYDNSHVRGEYHQNNAFPDVTSRDHEAVVQALAEYLETHPDDTEARFVYADQLMKLNRKQEAIEAFALVAEQHSVLWSEKAAWNYVLISAEGHWDDRAKEMLDAMLKDPSHSYHKQAQSLDKLMH